MIVWHEAATIEKAIASVRSVVDEVVVAVDEASTDGTREIVERLGCRVLTHRLSAELAAKRSLDDSPDWGFSKARNRALNECDPMAWRLILDGHEVFQNPEGLKAEVEAAAAEGCDCMDVSWHWEPDQHGIPQTILETTRALAPYVRYVNAQHNAPLVSKRHQAYHLIVEHRRHEQAVEAVLERSIQRSSATIAGFEAQTAAEPKNARAWFYLGRAYRENGRYQEAVTAFEKCLEVSIWNEERWWCRYEAGRCLLWLGEQERGREHLIRAIDEQPERAEAYYELGNDAYKRRSWREAEVWLAKCVEMPLPKCRLFLDPRVYWVARHDLLSMVYHHLGRFAEAAEEGAMALERAPNDRIRTNVEIWRQEAAERAAKVQA